MTIRAVLIGLLLASVGAAATGGVFWLLLNVPESNAFALALSAVLAMLLAILTGYTTSVVVAALDGATVVDAAKRGTWGLPGFLLGLAVFCALWFVTVAIDDQWTLHSGEIDALLLRYAGTANSRWLHTSISWLLWLVRWGVGLAVVCGVTTSRVKRQSVGHGFQLASSPLPLGATMAGLLVGYGLWSLVYWRPNGLPANTMELLFVSVKLSALLLLGVLIAVLVLRTFARTDASDGSPARPLNSPT
ncbi:MAG: hypothetical protein ABMA15_26800 [Vicinamibacterales bacterium]